MIRADYLRKHCIHGRPGLALHFGECEIWTEYQKSLHSREHEMHLHMCMKTENHRERVKDTFEVLNGS